MKALPVKALGFGVYDLGHENPAGVGFGVYKLGFRFEDLGSMTEFDDEIQGSLRALQCSI